MADDNLSNPAVALPLTWQLLSSKGWELASAVPERVEQVTHPGSYVATKRAKGDVLVSQTGTNLSSLVAAITAWEDQQHE